jgi:hypothetical protein
LHTVIEKNQKSLLKFYKTDYTDSLEMGIQPEEGSQYLVAPCIIEYINTKMILVSEEWGKYINSESNIISWKSITL